MHFDVLGLGGLVICVAYFFAGIVDAISGGGGLLTLSAMMSVNFPVRYIIGTNQMSAVLGGGTSLLRFARQGFVYWPAALAAMPTAIIGAIIGAKLNLFIPVKYLQVIMIVLIPLIAILVLTRKDFGDEDRSDELSRNQMVLRSILIGLVFGAYQGFYGAGSGTFFMLGFASLTRFDLIKASGTTKFVVFISCLTGALTYAFSGTVYWPMVLLATICNIVGNYIGASLAMTKGAKVIKPMFLGIMGLMMIKLIVSIF